MPKKHPPKSRKAAPAPEEQTARPPTYKPTVPLMVVPDQNADRAWFVAQLDKLGHNASDFSLAITKERGQPGVNPHIFGKTTRNQREATLGEAIVYARAFNAPLTEVIERLGYTVPRPHVEVWGTTGADGFVVPDERPIKIEGPSRTTAQTRGIRIGPHDQALAGAVIFYEDVDRVHPRAYRGQLSVLKFKTRATAFLGSIEEISAERPDTVVVRHHKMQDQQTIGGLTAACLVSWINLPSG